jgi:general stress protein YciG
MTSQHDQNRQDAQHSQSAAGQTGQQGAGRPGGRGFAGMDRERQREIASQGGRAAHASGNAHQFTSEEARAAGSKRHANAAARAAAAARGQGGNDQSLS